MRGEGVDEGDEEDDAKHPEDGGQKRSKVLGVASVHRAKEAHQGEAEEGNAKVENLPRLRHFVNLGYDWRIKTVLLNCLATPAMM